MALAQVQIPQVAPAQPTPPTKAEEPQTVRSASTPGPSGDAGRGSEEGGGPPTSRLERMSLQERKEPVHASGTEGKR